MKNLLMTCGVLTAFAAVADYPQIVDSKVTFDQDSQRLVTVTYKLAEAPAIVTIDIQTNGVSIGAENFASVDGAVNRLVTEAGTEQTILWQPRNDWPDRRLRNIPISARVTAWSTNHPPTYMVVDLTQTNREESVAAMRYYECAEAVPLGVSNVLYKTDRLVMRRIPAANVEWRMGYGFPEKTSRSYIASTYRFVTFTKDYYIGIYELTEMQYARIRGNALPEVDGTLPVRRNAINSHWGYMRGEYVGGPYEWPQKGHAVDPTRGLGQLRALTGIEFDLPTEAQWEFACRAGTLTALYSGKNMNVNNPWRADENCNEIGWVATGSYHEVGLKPCNAWGLYDMIGNASEICLDKAQSTMDSSPVVDPVGPETANDTINRWNMTLYRHVVRGASANDTGYYSVFAASDARRCDASTLDGGDQIGVRLVCPGAMVW